MWLSGALMVMSDYFNVAYMDLNNLISPSSGLSFYCHHSSHSGCLEASSWLRGYVQAITFARNVLYASLYSVNFYLFFRSQHKSHFLGKVLSDSPRFKRKLLWQLSTLFFLRTYHNYNFLGETVSLPKLLTLWGRWPCLSYSP